MESDRVPRLDSLCSTIYLETIRNKDIDECFNALKDVIESGCYITISSFLLEQSDEIEDSIQKKLTIAYCLVLYFQSIKKYEEDSSTIRTVPQLIIDIIYLHPYLNWNQTQSPYEIALTNETIQDFVQENNLEESHAILLRQMYPKDASLLKEFLDFEHAEMLGALFEKHEGNVDLRIADEDGRSVIQRWCDDPHMLGWYSITTKSFLTHCISNPLLEHQRHLLLIPEHGVLACVAHWGDLKLTQKLLELNADPNACYQSYGTALHAALEKPAGVTMDTMNSICKTLLGAKAHPDSTDSNDHTPLHYSAENSFDKTTKLLLQFNANPSSEGIDGNTPLHYAVDLSSPYSVETEENDNPDRRITNTIQLLLESNADPLAKNKKNKTSLDIASEDTPDNYELLLSFCKKGTKRKRPT